MKVHHTLRWRLVSLGVWLDASLTVRTRLVEVIATKSNSFLIEAASSIGKNRKVVRKYVARIIAKSIITVSMAFVDIDL